MLFGHSVQTPRGSSWNNQTKLHSVYGFEIYSYFVNIFAIVWPNLGLQELKLQLE